MAEIERKPRRIPQAQQVLIADLDRSRADLHRSRQNTNVAAGVVVAFGVALGFTGGMLLADSQRPPAAIVTTGEMPSLSPSPLITEIPGTPKPSDASGTPRPSGPEGTTNPNIIGSFDLGSMLKSIKGDGYALTIDNWHLITDNGNPGAVMSADRSGLNHVVSTLDTPSLSTVAQAYWEGNVQGANKAISVVFGPGLSVPVREATEWPVQPGQTPEQATEIAFQGQVNLEKATQPNVCVAYVDASTQAIPENRPVDLGPAPEWQPKQMTADKVAATYGALDPEWAGKATSWIKNVDTSGNWDGSWILQANPNGMLSRVTLPDAIGQAYIPAKVDGSNPAITFTLGVGTTMDVEIITVYPGVPQELAKRVLEYAHMQEVKLELGDYGMDKQQLGVYVLRVPKTYCPTPDTSTSVAPSPTAKPEATTSPVQADWRLSFEKSLGIKRAHPLAGFSNGLKIENGPKVFVTITKGERIDTPTGSFNGPWKGPVTVATIWKLASPTANQEPIKPVQTDWKVAFEKSLGIKRAHPLAGFSNGLKIENGPKVFVTITKGERIDTPTGSHSGPWKGYVTVATIWKL